MDDIQATAGLWTLIGGMLPGAQAAATDQAFATALSSVTATTDGVPDHGRSADATAIQALVAALLAQVPVVGDGAAQPTPTASEQANPPAAEPPTDPVAPSVDDASRARAGVPLEPVDGPTPPAAAAPPVDRQAGGATAAGALVTPSELSAVTDPTGGRVDPHGTSAAPGVVGDGARDDPRDLAVVPAGTDGGDRDVGNGAAAPVGPGPTAGSGDGQHRLTIPEQPAAVVTDGADQAPRAGLDPPAATDGDAPAVGAPRRPHEQGHIAQPVDAVDGAGTEQPPVAHRETLGWSPRDVVRDGGAQPDARPRGAVMATRIADLAVRLRAQPPPQRMALDLEPFGGGRVIVSLEADVVHVDTVDGPDTRDAGWWREVDDALRQRGLSLDTAAGRGGRGRDHRRPLQRTVWWPSSTTAPTARHASDDALRL